MAVSLALLLEFIYSFGLGTQTNFIWTFNGNSLGEGYLELIMFIVALPGVLYLLYNNTMRLKKINNPQ